MAIQKAGQPLAVIGAGAWGTALAMILSQKGYAVRLWEYYPEYAQVLDTARENPKFLPGIVIPKSICISNDLAETVRNCRILVVAVPAQAVRSIVTRLADCQATPEIIVSASKGIEKSTLCRMSEIIRQIFGRLPGVVALSGPSHAEEVSRGVPTSVVAASESTLAAEQVQDIFMTDSFRIYSSADVAGVELGGALKNVIALAAGVSDGLGLGDNTKAALLTRGLAEMIRLGKALHADAETFAGLSGIGDLVVTCTSQHSRNRRVGEELGRGRPLSEVLMNMDMVAEGVETTRSTVQLAERESVEMPITYCMHRILFEGMTPLAAVTELMQRPRKAETAA
ncbi:NAD(P)-dependent glycerol-3-phosphate dehydrogenase [candidate division FCPU426 bacterium]|nr:NAD(P)-dependent glycerol-3-phosphate dehydrogenase [candidate division FCPU426 bacterium]